VESKGYNFAAWSGNLGKRVCKMYVSAGKSMSDVNACTALFSVLRWHYKVIMGFGLLLNSTGYIIRTINTWISTVLAQSWCVFY